MENYNNNHESLKQIKLYFQNGFSDIEIRCLDFSSDGLPGIKELLRSYEDYTAILTRLIKFNTMNNFNIFISLNRSDIMLIDDLSYENLVKLANDYNIFYALETSAGNYQAILYFDYKLKPDIYKKIFKYLYAEYGGDKKCGSDITRIHRIAGFLNKKKKYLQQHQQHNDNNLTVVAFTANNYNANFFNAKYLDSIENIKFNKQLNFAATAILNIRAVEYFNKPENANKIRRCNSKNNKNQNIKDIEFIKKYYKNNDKCDEYIQNIYSTRLFDKKYKSLSELDLLVMFLCKKQKFTFKEIAAGIIKYRPESLQDKHLQIYQYLRNTYKKAY